MTNAKNEDFSLEAELAETAGWDLEDDTDSAIPLDDDGWVSGYADEPDPEEWPKDAELTVGMQDLAERHALRRVAGLSTELEDISEVEYRQLRLERVVLVGVWTNPLGRGRRELDGRARPAGRDGRLRRSRRDLPAAQQADPASSTSAAARSTGSREMVQATGADTVICDGELAPSQLRNLEDRLKVKVVDTGRPSSSTSSPSTRSPRRARRRSSWPS